MSRESLSERVLALRAQREAAHRRRRIRMVTRRDGVRCVVDGRELLNFCSNDYLCLSQHPHMIAAMRDAADEGAGSTGSHLVCGHGAQHSALEAELADWLQAPRALLFGSGYMANLAVVQALLGAGDVCVQDKLNHASLIDAARLAGCTLKRYPHNDADAAERQLAAHPDGAALLASDGVFSMDGDVAPLRALAAIARDRQATLYIDDAHAVGVLGNVGRGSIDAAGLDADDVPLRLVTFGKALGSAGAAVVGDADLIAHLAEAARPYLYTTALPPAQAAATRAAVRIAQAGDDLRECLRINIERLKTGAQARGLALLASDTPIQPLLVGRDADALAMSEALEAQGYWVAAIRPPTVPEGSARLRITLSAAHDARQVDGLLDALSRACDAVTA
ncbi:8-amino-7-oxononanoate synthase [Thermomonas carbonis]|uniref:8-amino-7-oxononanoate synthase n=1 Tax=Thermomonas carbonis TaxID=1463158 RepID=A0A7G9SSW0_9GAMM|nr:8-amino-7-oxononanoate synthase [Thermomonas carbonis]QNN70935.1 8-amino-7-oxononanoate synthase [Thermomonas carbonis]GHC03473.1 8-amino-7-oxononanoate synthase [Thermomonas carbonis]